MLNLKNIFFLVFISFIFFHFKSCSNKNSIESLPLLTNNKQNLIDSTQNLNIPLGINTITLLRNISIEFKENHVQVLEYEIFEKVLSLEEIQSIFTIFLQKYQKILHLEAYTLYNGKKTKANVEIFSPFHNKLLKIQSYKEIKNIKIHFQKIEKGSYLYLKYTLRTDILSLNSIYGEFSNEMKKNNLIVQQNYRLILPKKGDKKIYFKSYFQPVFKKKRIEKDQIIFSFFPKQKDQKFKLAFSSFQDWIEIQKSLNPIISSNQDYTFLKNIAIDIINQIENHDQKIEEKKIIALYHFVNNPNNIHNITIPFNLKHYFPTSGKEIFNEKYANSVDKTLLLYHLLKCIGIQNIYLGFVQDPSDKQFPTPFHFKQLILIYKNQEKYQFLDPYSVIFKYPFFPKNLYGKSLFILNPDFPELWLKIQDYTNQPHHIFYKINSNILQEDLELDYKIQIESSGFYEALSRIYFMYIFDPKIKILKKDSSILKKNGTIFIKNIDIPDPLNLNQHFTSHINFSYRKKNQNINPLKIHLNIIQNPDFKDFPLFFHLPLLKMKQYIGPTILEYKNEFSIPQNLTFTLLSKIRKKYMRNKNWIYTEKVYTQKNKVILYYKLIINIKNENVTIEERNNLFIEVLNNIEKLKNERILQIAKKREFLK